MKIDVKKVAKLANLTITPEEEPKLEKQLSDILQYVEQLNEVDVTGINPTSQVTGLENVTRDDKTEDCEFSQEEALSGGTEIQNGMFKVKALIET